ncbi:serine hydrolase domain-containing protein, partial [Pseudoflavonifractor phocaeensis]|uniref:serine hydrolase domain-containing protein n=1 Tax=Pseudoflavonifractor phocaeensis TaxID=1870988 RepID=UPI00195AA62F
MCIRDSPTPKPPITQEQLQHAVEQARADYGATAIQAAVIRDGQVAVQAASGWAVKDQITLTTRHKMRCASLTKVMVGISAGVLIDDGTLDPYADLSGYWGVTARNPSYPDTPITVDMLLTHTSTLSDASGSLSALKGTAARQRLAGSGYTGGKPGELSSWSYNNYGFSVLGMTLERAADQVLDDVLGEAVLTPMGIDAAFEAGSVDDTGLLCALYYPGSSLSRTVSTQKSYVCIQQPGYRGNFFAGGFTCSAGELAQLVAMLAEDGTYQGQQYLSAETVAYLEQPLGQTPDGFYQCRPLRYRENMYGRDRMYYHTGSAYGFYGLLSYDPDTGDGVVVFTTGASGVTDSYGVYAVCGQVAQAVYG